MALIKCPECGKEISDRAKECPRCGISMEEIQARLQGNKTGKGSKGESENNARTHKEEKKHTPPKGKKWLYYVIPAAIILIIAGIVFLPRLLSGIRGTEVNSNQESTLPEEPENVIPTITGNGVEPFVLDSSIMNIPPKGKFYDTILLSKHYGVVKGDHYELIDETEIEDYYRTMGSDYFKPDDIIGTAIVLFEKDTLLIVTYDESGIINHLEIFSNKLQLDNGIHTGLSSSEMFSKYNADFLTTDCFSGESWQVFYVPSLSRNITLFAFNNSVDGTEWYNNKIVDYEPDQSVFKCVKEEKNGNSALYKVPLDYVRDCSVKKIDVKSNGYEMFQLK